MKLICKPLLNGIMAYWERVEEAASYTVSLYINEQVISTRVIDRNEMYTTFNGLAAIDGWPRGLFRSLEETVKSVSVHGYCRSRFEDSGLAYYVQVQAENRNGEVIASSDKEKCSVKEL